MSNAPVSSMKPAQDGEQDEPAMDYDHQIRQETICHGCPAGMTMT